MVSAEERSNLSSSRKVILGVTDAFSLKLLGKLPEKFAESGWEVHVVSNASAPERTGSPVHRFHFIEVARFPQPLRDFVAFLSLMRIILRVRPEIVSFGTPKVSLLGLLASRILRVPVRIYFLRGLRGETAQGVERLMLVTIERAVAGLSTHILAVSGSLRAKYVSLGLAKEPKITVLGDGSSHGVDTSTFRRGRSIGRIGFNRNGVETGEAPTVGFVGRISIDKGISTVARAKRLLFDSGIDCRFRLYGPIESGHKYIEEMNSFGREVELLETVKDVSSVYETFDVLALPSMREGFPNVVLEAAVAGIPAVVFDSTGSRDAVKHLETGIVVPLGNEILFAAALEVLLTEPRLREKLGLTAQEWSVSEFDEDIVCKRIADFHLRQFQTWNNRRRNKT